RVLISSGAHDPLVPADHPAGLAELLRAGGAEVTVATHPTSHRLIAADLQAAHDWLGL
ncbi:MAG: alpha/beta hydrolase, partial [Opitutaceae bacterium]|nr:alpha/beta hydrolase [Opitutaceae bacterium]